MFYSVSAVVMLLMFLDVFVSFLCVVCSCSGSIFITFVTNQSAS
jgi:hypothetical protein